MHRIKRARYEVEGKVDLSPIPSSNSAQARREIHGLGRCASEPVDDLDVRLKIDNRRLRLIFSYAPIEPSRRQREIGIVQTESFVTYAVYINVRPNE